MANHATSGAWGCRAVLRLVRRRRLPHHFHNGTRASAPFGMGPPPAGTSCRRWMPPGGGPAQAGKQDVIRALLIREWRRAVPMARVDAASRVHRKASLSVVGVRHPVLDVDPRVVFLDAPR